MASLGSGTIGQFFFIQGSLVSGNQGNPALINTFQTGTGTCATSGQLGFFGSTSNKCASRNTFSIQSDTENSQLGAFLAFNNVGGFFACGANQDVRWKFLSIVYAQTYILIFFFLSGFLLPWDAHCRLYCYQPVHSTRFTY